MTEKKESFSLLNFGKTEIGTPKVSEVFGKDPWIKFGENNDFPEEILRLFQNADGLHSALIKRKVDMIAGLGFVENELNKAFVLNEYAKEDLNKVAKKCAFDLVLFGGYYTNIVWDAKGKTIAKIYHVPFEKMRIEKPTREDGEVSGYYISRDWSKYKKEENKPVLIPAFDIEDEQKRIEAPSQILFSKIYSPGMEFYCLPSYHSILNWLKLSFEISSFHIRNAQNSYSPGLIVSFPHLPPAEERTKVAQELKERGGALTSGEPLALFGESKDSLPEFTVLQQSNSDKKFAELMQQLNEEIYIGHQANNVIAGVAVAGKLANTSEVKEQYATFQATVISPLQKQVEETFNLLGKVNGFNEPLQFVLYNPSIEVVEDKEANLILTALNSLSPLVANKVLEKMTDAEIRGIIGLPPADPSTPAPASEPTQPLNSNQ